MFVSFILSLVSVVIKLLPKVIVRTIINNFNHGLVMRGFTMLELVVVICLISLLFVFAAERLLRLPALAERAAMQQVVGTLQSALAMVIAEHVAKGKIAELNQLAGTNPMTLLAEVPLNYRGTVSRADIDSLDAGQWYFAPHTGNLIYHVANRDDFVSARDGDALIRLRIEPVYDDRNANGRFDRKQDPIRGLRLQVLNSYTWGGVSMAGTEFIASDRKPVGD